MQLILNGEFDAKRLTAIKKNILAALAYFDLFEYPLTSTEIGLFLREKYEQAAFNEALKYAVLEGAIYRFGKFYSLKNDHHLVFRRNEGNRRAAELIKVAHGIGELLIRFPYVRGIAISGSLSKNYADEYSDIDLFIITAKNRLWIARSFMHAFKKLTFLLNKQDYFCMNYYIDEAGLEIKEKTVYTATEVVTLIPLQGDTIFEQFYAANTWTQQYLPNKIMRISSAKAVEYFVFKRFVEAIFNNALGNWLDSMLMKITDNLWNKKTVLRKTNQKGMVMAMAAGKHYAKPGTGGFHMELLKRYEDKLLKLLWKYNNNL